jgi:hypothetical protein
MAVVRCRSMHLIWTKVRRVDWNTPLRLGTSGIHLDKLSSTTNVNSLVTLASHDEENCDEDESTNEREFPARDLRIYVTTKAVNSGSVCFEIEDNRNNIIWVDPTTGLILVGRAIALGSGVKA